MKRTTHPLEYRLQRSQNSKQYSPRPVNVSPRNTATKVVPTARYLEIQFYLSEFNSIRYLPAYLWPRWSRIVHSRQMRRSQGTQ